MIKMAALTPSKVRSLAIAAFAAGSVAVSVAHRSQGSSAEPLHYAPNGNFNKHGQYLPAKAGFNLADVSSVAQLRALRANVKGLVWVGQCNGVDQNFRRAVQPYVGNPKVFGFYLMDDPDPRITFKTGKLSLPCSPYQLKAESDWVHGHMPGARTFIVLMNLSSSKTPSFENTYNPANSHID